MNANLGFSGKLILVKPNASAPFGTCPLSNGNIADFVGFGSSANCFEGAGPTATLSNTTSAVRTAAGCTDTENNSTDFSISPPTPRNFFSPGHVCANPIDGADFFVRQHYADFLNRQPDADGLAFWTNEITSCGTEAHRVEIKRINVSAAFFLSIEFQETGYLVERLYKSAYGDATGTSTIGGTSHQLLVPIVRFNEFLPDSQQISQGVIVKQGGGWEQVLENNKQTFISQFVQRSRFTSAFATSMTPAQFVDALFTHTGVTPSPSERTLIINEFGGAGNTADSAACARALRRVAENSTFTQHERNKAFVLMQYFGYLRRNPNNTPDADYSGYDFWLTKLNQFNGNFVNADMVKSFLISSEYRQRF